MKRLNQNSLFFRITGKEFNLFRGIRTERCHYIKNLSLEINSFGKINPFFIEVK